MRHWATFLLAALLVMPVAGEDKATRDARLKFSNLAARATANFRSADSIEANLHGEGSTLHPRLVALRLKIVAALDAAKEEIAQGEWDSAQESMKRADALLDRFVKELGGY